MAFTRGTGFIVQIKSIICMMVYIVAFISGMAAKSEPNVKIEMITPLTTQSTETEFEVTNNCLKAFKEFIRFEKLERNVNGEWQELKLSEWLNYEDALYKIWFIDKSILPYETWHKKFSLASLFDDDQKLTAGQYKLTFSLSYANDSETILVPCEFEVEQA